MESGLDYDTYKVETEFRVLAVLAEASSEREGFEFPVERFITFKGEKWQPWSLIDYNIPVTHLTLLEEKFPGKDRIQPVKYNECGTILTLFYDKAQKGTGISYSGGLHVATYNHETGRFWFV